MAPAKLKAPKKTKKAQHESDEEDDTIEGPWKFMGGLDSEDARMMRRVMIKIYKAYNSEIAHPAGPKYNVKILTRMQRARVNTMLKEAADDNPLLVSILTWFSKHFNTPKDEVVLAAAAFIRAKVAQEIRQPRQYRLAYAGAIDMWKAFLLDNDNTMGGGFAEPDWEAMLMTVDHEHIFKRAMVKRDAEDAGIVEMEVSFATAEDDEDTEPEEKAEDGDLVEAPVKKRGAPQNVFMETNVSTFKQTRSGRNFRSAYMQDHLYSDDEELGQIMEMSRLEAEEEENVRARSADAAGKEEKARRRALEAEKQELGDLRRAEKDMGSVNFGEPVRSRSQKKKKAREELAEGIAKKQKARETETEAANLGDFLGGLSVKIE